jgi:hypothetical protein
MKVKISLVVVVATLFAAGLAYGDGFNMVSWPLLPHDTSIQAVFADSMGTGCQLTGSFFSYYADLVRYYDASTSTWYSAWYNTTIPGWDATSTLTTIEPDKGYWIQIRGANPPVTLTMTGAVSETQRVIPVYDSATLTTFNLVGSAFAVPCSLADAGLVASGFTGSFFSYYSDKIRHWDGSSWYTAWYNTTTSLWEDNLKTLEPGKGYWLEVLAGHGFTSDEWIYPVPPDYSKGAKAGLSRQVKAKAHAMEPVTKRTLRSQGRSSTNLSLDTKRAAENKKTR